MPKAECLSGCWIDGSALETALAEQVLNLEVVPEGLVGGSDHCRVRRRGLCEGHQEVTVFMALKHSQQQRSHTGGGVPNCSTPHIHSPAAGPAGGMSTMAVHPRPHSGIRVGAFSTFITNNTLSHLICITSLFWRDFPFHFKVRLLRLQEAQRLAGGP